MKKAALHDPAKDMDAAADDDAIVSDNDDDNDDDDDGFEFDGDDEDEPPHRRFLKQGKKGGEPDLRSFVGEEFLLLFDGEKIHEGSPDGVIDDAVCFFDSEG